MVTIVDPEDEQEEILNRPPRFHISFPPTPTTPSSPTKELLKRSTPIIPDEKIQKYARQELIFAIERVLERYRGNPNTPNSPHISWDKVNGIQALSLLKDELEKLG